MSIQQQEARERGSMTSHTKRWDTIQESVISAHELLEKLQASNARLHEELTAASTREIHLLDDLQKTQGQVQRLQMSVKLAEEKLRASNEANTVISTRLNFQRLMMEQFGARMHAALYGAYPFTGDCESSEQTESSENSQRSSAKTGFSSEQSELDVAGLQCQGQFGSNISDETADSYVDEETPPFVMPRGRASLHTLEEEKMGGADPAHWWDVSEYRP